jgi:hypothetical protein
MDSGYSGAEAARRLGTTIPRVVRAVERLGLSARGRGGRLRLSPAMLEQLRSELGVSVEIDGLSPSETRALAALARAPLGLVSARALAWHAGLSPTAAARAVAVLERRGLAYREPTMIVAGRARHAELIHANRRHSRWSELAPLLSRVEPPRRPPARSPATVPTHLRHLFWNTAPAQLELPHGGPYVARRLLRTMDPEGLAWGAHNLSRDDWRDAAKARGLDPAVRALAANLAEDSSDTARPGWGRTE